MTRGDAVTPMVEVADLAVAFRDGRSATTVLDGLSLRVERDEVVCLLGPSGCGKLRVRREYAMTVVLVTHDIDESIYLADRVVVLSPRPASVVADLAVDLPPDRDQIATRESDAFVHLRARAAALLRDGSGAPERDTGAAEPVER
ncbi:hypothetical protein [Actinomycetospora lutea]|uniref:hypothetical protein n=1 Tax=Actinomycetospora lutea TaxID=663604 RepID=UPI003B684392